MVLNGQIIAAIGQPMAALGQCLWVPFRRQISYIKNLEENFDKLKQNVMDLFNKREDVNREINRDIISKMPTTECQAWLQKVGEMENKLNSIQAELGEKKMSCILGLCPNIWWRRNMGKQILIMIDDIVNLKDNAMFSGKFVVEVPPKSVEPIPAPIIEGNTSINFTVQKILRCIRDDDKKKISIWGMGGVGKTTTMKVLNNSPEISGIFQMVIWITVSKDGDIRKVQKDILKRLSLEFDDDESVERTASRIFQRLSNVKFLLILDDLWQKMDLEIIGIPNPSNENGCKMIITTRSMVICNKMEIDEPIKVDVLSEGEAWNLFCEKVGNVMDSKDINEIAKQVVRECQGLPLAIIVIGGSLRNKIEPCEWRNAWTELCLNRYEIIDDIEESVFKILKFSYDHLKSNNIKNCFLYCALYPEDYEIPEIELIQRWWAEGFIEGASSLNVAYDRGHSIINYLKNVSLLEGDSLRRVVKVHDVIRDLALTITSSSASFSAKMVREDGNQFLVRTNNIGIEELSNEEDWGQCRRISLTHNDKIRSLPENPKSVLLETLFLQHNENLTRIPELFFEHMHNLRVLDLSYTYLRELPSSVSSLVSLRGLYLLGCFSLVTLPSQIGNLKKLQVLHLGGDGGNFEYLPTEIQELTQLRSLQVSFENIPSGNRLMVPNGIISGLSVLEDLGIRAHTVWYESPKFGDTIAEEVASLKQLTQLEFHFTTLENFEQFLRGSCAWKNQSLKSFRFIVECNKQFGPVLYSAEEEKNMQYLRLLGGNYTPTVFAEVLQRTNGFHLRGHQTSRGLLDFGLKNLTQLKLCVVCECNMMKIIINGNDLSASTCAVLPNLEYLVVNNMPTMSAIWEGPMPPGSFSRLACLKISCCQNLRNIFTRGILQQLSNLEELDVRYCTVQGIVNEADEDEEQEQEGHDIALFPNLKILTLWKLRRLERIWKTVAFPMAPSLERITVIKCPNFKSLALSLGIRKNGGSASTLRKIEGEIQWWEALEWEHDGIKQLLRPLFHLWGSFP